ncbi:hypothetical protein B0J11DRAFT_507599 [Dendryphion nanum]|uniref:Uncharacterized protein n=1 Tax=Dendryphion nanum TaxID=256645 RepID=A0A9P9IHV1_9PLEO|nr:hypothetical protein B0J11DRAFT_507599 [Dendryphion nanum]
MVRLVNILLQMITAISIVLLLVQDGTNIDITNATSIDSGDNHAKVGSIVFAIVVLVFSAGMIVIAVFFLKAITIPTPSTPDSLSTPSSQGISRRSMPLARFPLNYNTITPEMRTFEITIPL